MCLVAIWVARLVATLLDSTEWDISIFADSSIGQPKAVFLTFPLSFAFRIKLRKLRSTDEEPQISYP